MLKKIRYQIAVCFSVMLLLLATNALLANNDSTAYRLNEVVVTGVKESKNRETSINIKSTTVAEMRDRGAFTLADGLAREAGVSQLSTGLGISKPVIRGLYGNRVLTLVSGMRFDNQQWQDEHGLGLSDIGVDRVELIKGPASILYGSDAVGGLLNVIEEKPAAIGTTVVDPSFRFHSNTLGLAGDVGIKRANEHYFWRIRAGAESQGDYTPGQGGRVLNSRFNTYQVKAGFGVRKGKWLSDNNYLFSNSSFGFILDDYKTLVADARWSRRMSGPFHSVILNLISSQNTKTLKSSTFKMNFGFQSNSRRENEGGNQISLNMHLITALYQLMWIKPLKADKLQLIISHGSTYENNTNYGGRIIIPDAHMFESSVAAFLKSTSGILTVEVGAGGNVKIIKTLETRQLNAPGANILPFTRTKPSFNGMLGIALNPNIHWNIKLNVASGFRAPNLAELSSNGVHEGIYRYEIGDPKMKNEQNLNEDLGITYQSKWFRAQASGFYMRFFNYVYIAPSANETFYGFPVFRFKQQNAAIYGSEAAFSLTPQGALKGLSWNNTFAYVLGKTDDANYLPYMPATWIDSRLDYQRITGKKVDVNLGAGFRYVFAQNHPFVNETKTPAYYLMDAHVGIDVRSKIGPVHIAIVGNNLLDAKYFDHLSRFKNYGIYNVGRDISLNFQFPLSFINHLKTNKK